MANQQAWNDREELLRIIKKIEKGIETINDYFNRGKKLIADITADNTRKNELIELMKEDPDWTLSELQAKIEDFKTMYNWLKDSGYITKELIRKDEL